MTLDSTFYVKRSIESGNVNVSSSGNRTIFTTLRESDFRPGSFPSDAERFDEDPIREF